MNYLQITTADATKLKCNFVVEAERYFRKLKYEIEPSQEAVLKTFIEYLYSMSVCLTDEDICSLKEIKEIKVQTPDCSSTFECVDIDATATFTESSCLYTTYVNPFSLLQLTNGSSSFNAVTDLSWISCDDEADLSLTSSTPFSYSGVFDFDNSVQHLLSNQSYIRYLNLTETNATGAITSTFTADLTIGTSVYYSNNASCVGCSNVTTSHLELSNSNFVTAFTTVLNNISIAKFGVSGRHDISVAKTGALTFTLTNKVRHNPTVAIFGLDFTTGLVKVYNPNTASLIQKSVTSLLQIPASFTASLTLTTDCGATLVPSATGASSFSLSSLTNFNKIVANSLISITPLSVTTPSVTCKKLTYTGTYNPVLTSVTEGWYQGLTQLNSLNTLTISEAGNYSYKVETLSGCEDSVDLTIINADLQ